MTDEENKIIQSPENKVPTGTMPQPCQRPDDKKVNDRPTAAFPVAAERYVYIVPEETAQGNMPAPPEFCDSI